MVLFSLLKSSGTSQTARLSFKDTKKKWSNLQVPDLVCLECMDSGPGPPECLCVLAHTSGEWFKAAGRPRTNGGADSEKTKASFQL